MRRLLGPLFAFLLSAALVVGPAGTAPAADGSFTFSVNPVGSIDQSTGLVMVRVTYSCIVPDDYPIFNQAEIQVPLGTPNGLQYSYIYVYPQQLTCDGQGHDITGVELADLGARAGRVVYDNAVGHVIWNNSYGDFIQLDYGPLRGSMSIRPTH